MIKQISENDAMYMTELIDYYEELGNKSLINDTLLYLIMSSHIGVFEDEAMHRFNNVSLTTMRACLLFLLSRNVLIRYREAGDYVYKINEEYFKDKEEYQNIKQCFE